MAKYTKKFLMLALAIMMVLQLAGCGDKGNAGTASGGEQGSMLISEEPVELTMFFRASKDPDGQWRMMKKAAEMTNVMATTTVSKSNSNMTQTFNLMLASGEIPDLVFAQNDIQFVKYGIDGAFVPLNKHLDIMPNVKAFLDENPEVKKRLTASDGNIYYMPFMPGGKASTGWFVRQDWLDKLGLKTPKTAEDVYNVLKAFKTKDPNGNGKADEVPYFASDKVTALFPLWGAREGWYVEKNKVKYGPMEPNYKTAMSNIIKWYKEGLLDQEIVTRQDKPRDKMLMNNVGGMTHDWFGSTARFNDTLQDDIPGFSFVPIAPPEGVELNKRTAANYGWGVYTGSKYVDIALKYIDFWYSEAGSNLINFGEEGVHWEMVDGEPQFKAEILALDNPQKEITEFGCQMGIGYVQNFEYEKQWMNQIGIDGMEMYEKGNWYAEQMPPIYMQMTREESEEYNLIKTQIDTYTSEKFQKWILGSEDFEKGYAPYLKELEKLNISRLVELQQIAYDRYLKA